MEKIKARLGYEGLSCESEGQARGLGAVDRRGSEAWVEGLVPMDRDDGEDQARLWSMNQ